MEKYQIDSGVDRGAKMGSSGLTSNDIKVVALGDSQAVVVFRRHLNKGREEEINGTRPGWCEIWSSLGAVWPYLSGDSYYGSIHQELASAIHDQAYYGYLWLIRPACLAL